MSEETIKVGDVVILKSGGPAMTVYDFPYTDGEPMAMCMWFGNNGEVNTRMFPIAVLELSGRPGSSAVIV